MTPSQKKANELLDAKLRGSNGGVLVSWFLMASYLYYQHDISLLTDEKFDWMCKEMLKRWETIEHQHKRLIDKGDLAAGTGYAIAEYPEIVKHSATRVAEEVGLIVWDKKKRTYRLASSIRSKPKTP